MGLNWITTTPYAIDHGGPTQPFEPVAPFESGGIGWFERAVARYPDRLAVIDDRDALSYRDLLDRIYGLAAQIARHVPVGEAVVSLLANGSAAAVAMLAAACCGRTIIPIDAGHPIERQLALFAAGGSRFVLSERDQEIDPRLLPPGTVELRFDVCEQSGAKRPAEAPRDPATPSVVVFTSGSTNVPKGVAHILRTETVIRFVDKFHVTERDVFISLASMSQTGIADLICLAAGATLHIVDIRRRGMMAALDVMRSAGVTVLSFVPSALRVALAVPGIEQALASLRVLDLHGERILASDIALLRAKLPPDCHICVTYGATEVGAAFTWFVRDEAIVGETVPIGYLRGDLACAFVGEDDASVGEGDTGELLIRGPIAIGDWAGGRLVRDRFLPAPGEPGSSIYAMGDLVRMRADGLAEFVGRRDRKVKIRGLWVDLGEVEAALRACDAVVEAVAMVKQAAGEPDTLAAFVVPLEPDAPPAAAAVRRDVAAATAEHMAPGRIVFLASIPRLPNYKPDLVCLKAML